MLEIGPSSANFPPMPNYSFQLLKIVEQLKYSISIPYYIVRRKSFSLTILLVYAQGKHNSFRGKAKSPL